MGKLKVLEKWNSFKKTKIIIKNLHSSNTPVTNVNASSAQLDIIKILFKMLICILKIFQIHFPSGKNKIL